MAWLSNIWKHTPPCRMYKLQQKWFASIFPRQQTRGTFSAAGGTVPLMGVQLSPLWYTRVTGREGGGGFMMKIPLFDKSFLTQWRGSIDACSALYEQDNSTKWNGFKSRKAVVFLVNYPPSLTINLPRKDSTRNKNIDNGIGTAPSVI